MGKCLSVRSDRSGQSVAQLMVILPLLSAVLCASIPIAGGRSLTHDTEQSAETIRVLAIDFKERLVKAGDRVVVVVTVRNEGQSSVMLPPGALKLKMKQWSRENGGMVSDSDTVMPLISSDSPKGRIELRPGDNAVLSADVDELRAVYIGQVSATLVVQGDDKILPGVAVLGFDARINFYSGPSDLMRSVWSARTTEEQEHLRRKVRDVLLSGARAAENHTQSEALQIVEHMGCYAMPYLEAALGDSDAAVRKFAIFAASDMVPFVHFAFNRILGSVKSKDGGSAWDIPIERCDGDRVMAQFVKIAMAGLTDGDGGVRSMSIDKLAGSGVKTALPAIQNMSSDPDPRVRASVQKSLSRFADFGVHEGMIDAAIDSLDDRDATVREQAIEAMKRSPEPPPLTTLDRVFQHAAPEVGAGLIELMYEQEDPGLPSRLLPRFKDRSPGERLAILTAIAGQNDDAALKLASLGLMDTDPAVQRAALMRLLAFPTEKATAILKSASAESRANLKELAVALQDEAQNRELFSFLAAGTGSAREVEFPSKNGTQPMVSPDGRWVAYVETGWGRPGGSGGSGRSNLLSLLHAARSDSSADRIVSDMFLVAWLSDSARIASARDAFAAIVNLNGSMAAEFGEILKEPYSGGGFRREAWPNGSVRAQLGTVMPHSKRIGGDDPSFMNMDIGEDAAFSPDGKWLGPLLVKDTASFIDTDGHRIEFKLPQSAGSSGKRATWSPDGRYVLIVGVHPSNTSPNQSMVETVRTLVIDLPSRSVRVIEDVDEVPWVGQWDYRKGRWNPWSKDSTHIAFIRHGQVWIADPTGGNARQLTFDRSNKVFPTFSPDGSRIAYITLQNDERKRYRRLGPTDLWVVDIGTTISARITAPASSRIESLDWLDNHTIIFDRVDPDDFKSTLRTISLF